MAVPVIMPRQGQSVESCILTEWYKEETQGLQNNGQQDKQDEPGCNHGDPGTGKGLGKFHVIHH